MQDYMMLETGGIKAGLQQLDGRSVVNVSLVDDRLTRVSSLGVQHIKPSKSRRTFAAKTAALFTSWSVPNAQVGHSMLANRQGV